MRLGLLLGLLLLYSPVGAAWTSSPPLPEAYIGHALVAHGGRLYNIGGLGGFNGAGSADRVFSAAISGGAVSDWRSERPLPEPIFFHAAVVARGAIWVLGGFHYTPEGLVVSNHALYAAINPDGTLGQWRRGPDMPEPVFFTSAAAWNDAIYVTGGWNGTALTNGVYSLVGDAWRRETSLPEGLYTHAAVSNGTLYVLGGVVSGGTEVESAVLHARIGASGALGAWTQTTALPQPLSNHGASIANGRVILTGGWTGVSPTADAVSSIVNSDQSLGAWSPLDSLPVAVYLHAQAVTGSHLFVTGGTDAAAPRADVLSLPLPQAPAPADALAPRTTLAVGEPRWVSGETTFVTPATPITLSAVDDARVVGDGAGVGVETTLVGIDELSPYTGPLRLPNQGAHLLRYLSVDRAGLREPERAASIAVDGTAPVSAHSPARARLSAADRLTITAEDPVVAGVASGVSAIELAVDGVARDYEGAFGLPEGARTLAYRALDRLGNAEPWRSASFEVDLTAPETTWSLAGQALFGVDIVTPNTAITLSASDPVSGGVSSGVERTLVSVDGAAETAYTGPFTLPSGAHEVRARSFDLAGNAEDARVFRVAVSDFLSDAAAALESATLSGGASISGDLRAPVVALNGQASVSGRTIRQAPVAAFDLAAAKEHARAARDLGAIKLSGKQTLALEPGDYFASELTMSAQTALSVSGRVNLFVGGAISVSGGAQLNAGGAADSLWLVSDGPSASLSGHSRSAFNLYAPNADVAISGSGELAGRLLGRTLALSGKGVVPVLSSGAIARAGKRKTSAPAATLAQAPSTQPVAPAAEKRAAAAPLAKRANTMPTLSIAGKSGLSIVTDKGGRARGGERAAVTIPQGAAPAGLAVTVAPGAAPDRAKEKSAALNLAAAGAAVEFGPHGARFNKPVTIELPFDEYREGLLAHYWNESRGEWEPLPSVVDRAAKVVRAETTHFSLYQVLAPAGAAANVQAIAQAYAFPNPARPGQTPTIRVEASGVEGCELKVYDVAGELKHQAGFSGARATYEFSVPGLGSGVYIWSVKAGTQTKRGRLAVIR